MAGDVNTASGTKIHIGPAAGADVDDATAFAALTGWVEIGNVESLGEFGDEASSVTFASLGDGRMRKSKGVRNAGTLALVVGRDPTDEGQDALIAAEATKNKYAFRITYADRLTPAGTDSVEYFRALVLNKRSNVGNADNIVRRSFSLDIDSAIVAVDAT